MVRPLASRSNLFVAWGRTFTPDHVPFLQEGDFIGAFDESESEEAGDYLETIEHAVEILREQRMVSLNNVLDSLGYFIKKKEHPMDAHYPHTCANSKTKIKCNKKLKWLELLRTNARTLSFRNSKNIERYDYKKYKQLKQWWRSKHVEFLCCSCFAFENEKRKLRNKKEIIFGGIRRGDLTLC